MTAKPTDDESNDEQNSRIQQLEQRLETLEERTASLTVEDDNGRRLSIGRLLEMGLTRRQALAALGLVAYGSTATVAIMKAIGTADAQDASNAVTGIEQLGTEANPIDEIYTTNLYQDTDNIIVESINANEIIDGADVSHTGEIADDGDTQPPEDHDNTAHNLSFVSDGDGTERQTWIIANGASDPAGADPEDIILEEES